MNLDLNIIKILIKPAFLKSKINFSNFKFLIQVNMFTNTSCKYFIYFIVTQFEIEKNSLNLRNNEITKILCKS